MANKICQCQNLYFSYDSILDCISNTIGVQMGVGKRMKLSKYFFGKFFSPRPPKKYFYQCIGGVKNLAAKIMQNNNFKHYGEKNSSCDIPLKYIGLQHYQIQYLYRIINLSLAIKVQFKEKLFM